MAMDGPAAKASAKAPISLHPAFPAVVAVWFAALLGLGSMALPSVLLDRAVAASGLASAVPAAAPPLGIMARGLIALAAAVVGAALGVALAWRVARSHEPPQPARFATSFERRPISVHDEVDDEGISAAPPMRKMPAMAEDQRPSDFLWVTPLPGEPDHCDVGSPVEPPSDDALELCDLALDEPAEAAEAASQPSSLQDPPISDVPPVQFPPADELNRRREDRRRNHAAKGPGGFERQLYLRQADDEPLPFVAPSLGRRMPDNENGVPDGVAVNLVRDVTPQDGLPPAPAAAEARNVARDERESLVECSTLELVERLAASLEKRRAWAAAPAAASRAQPVLLASAEDEVGRTARRSRASDGGLFRPAGGSSGAGGAREAR